MKPERKLSAIDGVLSVVVTDATVPDNPIVYVNRAFEVLTGYSARDCIRRNCRFLQGRGTDMAVAAEIRRAVKAGQPLRRELLNYRKDGTAFWNELAIDPIRNKRGRLTGFVAVLHDTTQKHAMLIARKEVESRLSTLLDTLPGFMFEAVANSTGTFDYTYISSSAKHLFGLLGDCTVSFEVLLRWIPAVDQDRLQAVLAHAARTGVMQNTEFRLVRPSNEDFWFRAAVSPRTLPDGRIALSGLALDISEERASRLHAAYLESNDPLTKLLNRHKLRARIAETVVSLDPDQGETALLIADLDDFQSLNDAMGMPTGDRVLRRIGMRVAEFAEEHGGIAGRFGGDEFAAMLPNRLPGADVGALAAVLCEIVGQPVLLDGQAFEVTACVGAATLPQASEASQGAVGEELAEELLKRAQLALVMAKRNGAGFSRIYTPDVDDRIRHQQALRRSLQRAIVEEQFELHYQPQVELATGSIVGVEALVRWQHPEFGLQRPDVFIPMAESSGQIVALGALLMRMVMRQQRVWVRRGLTVPLVSVNVSGVQLRRPGFVAMVQAALDETGARAKDFELELTETTLLESDADITSQLAALREIGFSLAIDDFGAGHATMKYLREFPVDRLKIDQSFIRHLVLGSSDVAIVNSMVSLGAALGLDVVAEGIETVLQRDFLRDAGCLIGQGYLFSMPLKAEDLGWMLRERITLPVSAGGAGGGAGPEPAPDQ